MAAQENRSAKVLIARTLVVALSCVLCGVGSGTVRASCLGNDPFSALCFGVSQALGTPMSLTMPAVNAIILVAPLLLRRDQIGVGTICNMGICGFGVDLAVNAITSLCGGTFPSYQGMEQLPLRIAIFLCAMAIVCVACSFYMGAAMGVAPYDSLAPIVEQRTGGRVPFRVARIVTDVACVAGAVALLLPSGTQWQVIGLGTVLTAFCFGPIIDLAMRRMAQPFYEWLDSRLT